jgi:hypothetical protein
LNSYQHFWQISDDGISLILSVAIGEHNPVAFDITGVNNVYGITMPLVERNEIRGCNPEHFSDDLPIFQDIRYIIAAI